MLTFGHQLFRLLAFNAQKNEKKKGHQKLSPLLKGESKQNSEALHSLQLSEQYYASINAER